MVAVTLRTIVKAVASYSASERLPEAINNFRNFGWHEGKRSTISTHPERLSCLYARAFQSVSSSSVAQPFQASAGGVLSHQLSNF
jgi:hypothetical protein